jgi:diadenosine tetraphosphate (Ap4A) HIT family hydrolase
MKHENCIFCNSEKRYIIKETELAIATYFPRAIKKGHFVVAVKEHLPTFSDISPEQAKAVIELALEISKVIEKKVGAEKTYIAAIGDKDLHFHIHLFPKLTTDAPMGIHIMTDAGWKKEVWQDVTDQEVMELIEEIKGYL